MSCCPLSMAMARGDGDGCLRWTPGSMNATLVFSSGGRGPRASTATTDRSVIHQNQFSTSHSHSVSSLQQVLSSVVQSLHHLLMLYITSLFPICEGSTRRGEENRTNPTLIGTPPAFYHPDTTGRRSPTIVHSFVLLSLLCVHREKKTKKNNPMI